MCCGIGSISFEFGSRGCSNIISVDQQSGTLSFINNTAKQLDLNITTVKSDLFKFLDKTPLTFDVILPTHLTVLPKNNLNALSKLLSIVIYY